MEANARDRATLREEIHRLVDQLPDGELETAQRFVEYLCVSGHRLYKKLLHAPIDDEPVTEEEGALVAEARDELDRGEAISHDEVMREFRW